MRHFQADIYLKAAARVLAVLAPLCVYALASQAEVSSKRAAALGQSLTPIGAELKGNADGSIPAWSGGITVPPRGYRIGANHVDPFAADKSVKTITSQNYKSERDYLADGVVALLKKYPSSFSMQIYPTRRSASYPNWIYAATFSNATRARLKPSGLGISGAVRGVPFPIPNNGLEVVWNHLTRYRGTTIERTSGHAMPTSSGDFKLITTQEQIYFYYNRQGETERSLRDRNVNFLLRGRLLAPGSLAGSAALLREPLDFQSNRREVWMLNKGERKVRRVAGIDFDVPGTTAEGLRTSDDLDMFSGSPELYNWSLLGKRELYVAYNSYRLQSDKIRVSDIVQPHHVNPAYVRYEKHRVWVVEGVLKQGREHLYGRRKLYVDEDSWQILVTEMYGRDGSLWRVGIAHGLNFYELPALKSTLEVIHDLRSGRYLAIGLDNQLPMINFNRRLSPADFSSSALRRFSRR